MDERDQPPDALRTRRAGRIKLLALVAFFLLPVAAGYLAYSRWTPESGSNHGELLQPRPIEDPAITALRGKWVLVQFDSGACEAYCERKQYFMRQVRKAMGKEQVRIERLWLVTDQVAPRGELLEAIAGTVVDAAAASRVLPQFDAAGAITDHIYLVDPLGNLMMRYRRDPDPARMIKDLQRLLKTSRFG